MMLEEKSKNVQAAGYLMLFEQTSGNFIDVSFGATYHFYSRGTLMKTRHWLRNSVVVLLIAVSTSLGCGGDVFQNLLDDNSEKTVTYNANGATSGTVPGDTAIYAAGDDVTVLGNTGNLERTGHTFNNWNTTADGNGTAYAGNDVFTMSDRSVILYAQWTPDQHTLTYSAGVNGAITGSSPQTVNYGSSGTAVTAVPDTGYHFVQWSDGVLTASRTDTNVTGDVSVTAQFSINQYTLTYSTGANGSVSGDSPQTVNHGADGTAVSANPAVGFFFTQWSDGSTQNPRTDTNVTSDITVTAVFDSQYTLTYTAETGGSILGDTPQFVNPNDDGTVVEALADSGYRFDKWSDDVFTAARTDTDITGNLTVSAQFIRQWTLTYTGDREVLFPATHPRPWIMGTMVLR